MHVIIITLLAAFFTQLGFFLWKVAADSLPDIGKTKPLKLAAALLTNIKWLCGFASTIVGWVLFITATNIGAISLVQPLMSTGDLFLVLMAVVFLGERLNRNEIIGLVITVAGATLLSFEVRPIMPITLDWPKLGIFLAVMMVAVVAFYLWLRKSKNYEITLGIIVGIAFGLGAVFTKLMTAYIAQDGAEPTLLDFVFNPILPLLLVANVVGLVLLQAAFQKGRASVIVPLELAMMNAVAVIAGAVLFFEEISVFHGMCIVLIALGALFMKRSAKH